MTIKQLVYLLEVAKTGSFTSASENMYISQSSLSKQIKALEDEIGLQLLSRTTRSVHLTPAGREIAEYADKITHTYNQMMDTVSSLKSLKHDTLRLTLIPSASSYGILQNVMDFCQVYPEIDITAEELDPLLALKLLINRKTDACIMRGSLVQDKRLKSIPLISDEMVLIASTEHPLAQQDEISLQDLADEQFYLLSEQTLLYNYCINLCQSAGFTPHVAKQAFRLSTILEFVSANLGISLIMRQVALQNRNESLKIIRLRERPVVDLSVVIKAEDNTDVIRLFINFLQECYGVC